MARTPKYLADRRTPYFVRSDDSSFNLANIVEDIIESIIGFVSRYTYTTGLIFWSPRSVAFHILTHNRRFRLTRPYSYFVASFLLLAVIVAVAAGAATADILGRYFSISPRLASELAEQPDPVKLFLSLGPIFFLALIGSWINAYLTSLILVSRYRRRRIFRPLYFGTIYVSSVYLLAIGSIPIVEILFASLPKLGIVRDIAYMFGIKSKEIVVSDPDIILGTMAGIFFALLFVNALSLGRLLYSFAKIGGRSGSWRITCLARTMLAWLVATTCLLATFSVMVQSSETLQLAADDPAKAKEAKHARAWEVLEEASGKVGELGRTSALHDLHGDGASLAEAPLAEARLDQIALPAADLRNAVLHKAHMRNADLRGVSLRGADMRRVILYEANLDGADLREADLSKADLRGALMEFANLRRANLSDTQLGGAHLQGADLFRASLVEAELGGADLSEAKLFAADLTDASLRGVDLSRADLFRANLAGARLDEAEDAEATFCHTIMPDGSINNRDC